MVLLHSNTALIFIAVICAFHSSSTFSDRFTLIPQCTCFPLARKIMLFPYEKVVITQFDTCRRFYAPIHAKWVSENFLYGILLTVQSCKLYNNKYMLASTQITHTEIFTFIAVLVLKLLNPKVLFINRKYKRNC